MIDNESYYYFEASDPVDLSKRDLDYILKLSVTNTITEKYGESNFVYVSPKIDGTRGILYNKINMNSINSDKVIYDEKMCFMITRRGKCYEVDPGFLPNELKDLPFIFDLEIVEKENDCKNYYIMDIIQIGYVNLRDIGFRHRLSILQSLHFIDNQQPYRIKLKIFRYFYPIYTF